MLYLSRKVNLYIIKSFFFFFPALAAGLITCHTCSKNWLQPLECQSRLLQRETDGAIDLHDS